MAGKKPITAQRLRGILHYDPETGVLRWRHSRGGWVREGQEAGSIEVQGYRQIKINRRSYKAHRLAWLYMTGEWPPHEIDHDNLDRSDNRWKNLRDATNSQNGANRRAQANNTSGFKGVSWHKASGKWRATIGIGKLHRHIGLFDDPVAASVAYANAAEQHFGNFARVA